MIILILYLLIGYVFGSRSYFYDSDSGIAIAYLLFWPIVVIAFILDNLGIVFCLLDVVWSWLHERKMRKLND